MDNQHLKKKLFIIGTNVVKKYNFLFPIPYFQNLIFQVKMLQGTLYTFFLLFKGSSQLLICGGYNLKADTCEVINLESPDTTCNKLTGFPTTVKRAIGGLGIKGNLVICGGEQNNIRTNNCYTLENNEWVSSDSMNSVRVDAAAVQLQDGTLLVTGGSGATIDPLNFAEILTEGRWEINIPSLPAAIYAHCMIAVNSTTVIAIGGSNGQWSSNKTFYYTFGDENWTEGPQLKNQRGYFGCGKIRKGNDSQEMSLIVAGGIGDGSYLSSVEILDGDSNEWHTGPELPFKIGFSQMVEDQNGGVVLVGGESSLGSYLDTLFQLTHGGEDAVWAKMEQRLKIGRYWHTAVLVHDKIVDCS